VTMQPLRDVHIKTIQILKDHGIPNPTLESRLLACFVYDLTPEAFILESDRSIDEEKIEIFIKRRVAGEPLSKIIGEKEFWSHRFYTSSKTLDPRPDSEVLIESALSHVKDKEIPLRILDMGTGTGCLALTLLLEFPNAQAVGLDISTDALEIAQKNAALHGVEERVDFIEGDFSDVFDDPFDLVISNPPYIPTRDIDGLQTEVRLFDPMFALDGGIDGLDPYRILAKSLGKNLKNKGLFVLEFGIGQAEDVCAILKESDLAILEVNRDIENRERCIIGQNHR